MDVPAQGFGCWRIKDETSAVNSVKWAIAHGYRLIDDAAVYMNEPFVGRAIKESGIDRKELFVVSKIWVQDCSYEGCKHALAKSLERLGLDYLDLYMIHWPLGDYLGAWKAMEEFVKAGKIKALGVCNFTEKDLDNLLAHCTIKPVMNQVECHPIFQQKAMHRYLDEHGILMEAWSPLGHGSANLLADPLLMKLGEAHHKTAAQIILRWAYQEGILALPKSEHEERIAQNLDVFDFKLSETEMNQIRAMDTNHRLNNDDPYSEESRKIIASRVYDIE
jgi:2,5-diketo-D-gluconate reductase A